MSDSPLHSDINRKGLLHDLAPMADNSRQNGEWDGDWLKSHPVPFDLWHGEHMITSGKEVPVGQC